MKSKYIVYLVVFVGISAVLYGLIFGFINERYPETGSEFPDVRGDAGFWLLVGEWVVFFPMVLYGVRKAIRMARQDPPGGQGEANDQ